MIETTDNLAVVCKKLKVTLTVLEKDFNSRSEVINWIIDTQINRRNITDNQRSYLIGKRYKEEKKEQSRPKIDNNVGTVHTLPEENKRTVQKIAEQTKVNPSTVQRAEKFAEAVDQVAKTTGVSPQKIIAGDVKATQNSIHQQTSIFTRHSFLKIVIDRHIDKIQVDPVSCTIFMFTTFAFAGFVYYHIGKDIDRFFSYHWLPKVTTCYNAINVISMHIVTIVTTVTTKSWTYRKV